jgi:hypothetical protein
MIGPRCQFVNTESPNRHHSAAIPEPPAAPGIFRRNLAFKIASKDGKNMPY